MTELSALLIAFALGVLCGAGIYHTGLKTGTKIQFKASAGKDPFEKNEEDLDQTHTFGELE